MVIRIIQDPINSEQLDNVNYNFGLLFNTLKSFEPDSTENTNLEVLQARIGYDGFTYQSLKERLDTEIQRVIINKLNVKNFGAVGDGVTDDTAAINSALAVLKGLGGGSLYFPVGTYIIDFVLKIDFDCQFEGDGQNLTILKVKDQSALFHDPSRSDNINNVDIGDLYRDYYAMIFVNEANFGIFDMQLDANAQNNFMMLGGNKYNVVIPGNEGVNYYRYYHGIATRYRTLSKPKLEINNCYIHHAPWNGVVINNNGVLVDGKDILVTNSKFESTSRDLLSLHNIDGAVVEKSTFINPDSHAVHFYIKANNTVVRNCLFEMNANFYEYLPRPTFDTKAFFVFGSSYDNNIIENPLVINNTMDAVRTTKNVTAFNFERTVSNVRITGNKGYNLFRVMTMQTPTIGTSNIMQDNEFTYNNSGIRIIPFGEAGTTPYVDVASSVTRPFSSNFILRNNEISYVFAKSRTVPDIYYRTFGMGNTIGSTGLTDFRLFIESSNVYDNAIIDVNGVFSTQREKTLHSRQRNITGSVTGSSYMADILHVQNTTGGALPVNILRIHPLVTGGLVQVNLKLIGSAQFTAIAAPEVSIEYDIEVNLATNTLDVRRKGGANVHTFLLNTVSDGTIVLSTSFAQFSTGIIDIKAVSRNHFISPILTDYSSNFF